MTFNLVKLSSTTKETQHQNLCNWHTYPVLHLNCKVIKIQKVTKTLILQIHHTQPITDLSVSATLPPNYL